MATKLNQLLAISKGVKATALSVTSNAYQNMQKAPLLSGVRRTYKPLDEDGLQLPAESTKVQLRTEDAITSVAEALTRLFDVVTQIDETNCAAKGDIAIGGENGLFIADVPVTTLLFLEKQLVDIATFVRKLPVLDPAEDWTKSDTSLVWESAAAQTVKTAKMPRVLVRYEATDKHPAQTEVYNEDRPVGVWTTTKLSGAVPASFVVATLDKVSKLTEAVKTAREQANMTPVVDRQVGAAVFGYLFG